MDDDSSDNSEFFSGLSDSLENFKQEDLKDIDNNFQSILKDQNEFLIFRKVIDKLKQNPDAFQKLYLALPEDSKVKLQHTYQKQLVVVNQNTGAKQARRIVKIKRKQQ